MEVIIPDKEVLLKAITCLECGSIPRDNAYSQVYMCGQSHLFCITCVTRGSFREKKCRKRSCQDALKKVVEPILADIYDNCYFTCANQLCPEAILGRDLQEHRNYCHYAPIACPDCGKVVEFQSYLAHIEQSHKVPVQYVNEVDWIQWVPIDFPPRDENGFNISHYHNFHGKAFFVHFIVKPKDIYIWIQYYGGCKEEENYTVTVCLFNNQGHRTEITVPINSIRENFPRARELQSFAHFSKELLRCYIVDTNNNSGYLSNIRKVSVSSRSSSYNGEYELPAGRVNFQIIYKHNFLKTFLKNLYIEEQQGGKESEC